MSSGTTYVNVHAVGFVWATMLWDLHWKMVEKYGYASDVVVKPKLRKCKGSSISNGWS